MERNEDDGLLMLAPLRDAEPDIRTGVDINKAKKAGRRTVRNRMVASVAAASSLVVLAGVAVATIGSMPQSVAPARGPFDVLKQTITVGTAGGFTPDWYQSTPYMQHVGMRRTDGSPGIVTVTVRRDDTKAGSDAPVAAEDVNGEDARWVGPDHKVLKWRLADGSFAEVKSEGATTDDIKVRLQRVAMAVQPADRPFHVPFTLPKDDSLKPSSMWVKQDSAESTLILEQHFGPTGYTTLEVSLKPNDPTSLAAEATYDGHKLLTSDPTTANSTAVELNVAPGLMAHVRSSSELPQPETVNRLAAGVRVVPDQPDRRTWPTTVWR